MGKKIIWIFIIGVLITFVIAEAEHQNNLGTLKIQSSSASWKLLEHSGIQEQYFTTTLEDLGNGKAKVCLIPKTSLSINEDIVRQSKAYLFKNNVKTREVEPSDMETEKEAGKVKKLCLDIDKDYEDKIQFGNSTIVYVYQEAKTLEYETDWGATANLTLYKNISGTWNNTIDDIWIRYNIDNYKFGANDSSQDNVGRYKYTLTSTSPIMENGFKPYIYKRTTTSQLTYEEERHYFNFNDICSKQNISDTKIDAECDFNFISPFELEISFYSDEFIDPTISVSPHYAVWGFPSTNASSEEIATHLKIDEAKIPYNNLVFYYSFDADENDTTGFTARDYSNQKKDGTGQGNAVTNSTRCFTKYNNCFQSDGETGNYISSTDWDVDFKNGITISVWIYPIDAYQAGQMGIWSDCDSTAENGTHMKLWGDQDRVDTYIGNTTDTQRLLVNNVVSYETWQHLVFTSNGSNLTLWIDGDASLSKKVPMTNISDNSRNQLVGLWEADANDVFNGSIDELMIFNTTLTDQQIIDIYNNQSSRFRTQGNFTISPINISNGSNILTTSLSKYKRDFDGNLSLNFREWNIDEGYNNTLDTSIIAYYHFDEESWEGTSGEVKDVKGIHNGTAQLGINSTESLFYRGATFNGSYAEGDGGTEGARIVLPVNPNSMVINDANYTIALWYKVNDVADRGILYNERARIDMIGNELGWLGLEYNNGAITGYDLNDTGGGEAGSTLSYSGVGDELWHHVVMTKNSYNQSVLYVDGVSRDSEVNSASNFSYTGYSRQEVGSGVVTLAGTVYNLNGSIDELILYNKTLSASEVQDLYLETRANFTDASSYQNLSGDATDETAMNNFTLNTSSTLVRLDFNLIGDNFYTPLLTTLGQFNLTLTDNINPTINITSPINGTNSTNHQLVINFTRSDSLLNKCWYSNDTFSVNTTIANCGNLTGVNWNDAPHNVTIYVNDTAGNINESSVNFTITSSSQQGLSSPQSPHLNITNITEVAREISIKLVEKIRDFLESLPTKIKDLYYYLKDKIFFIGLVISPSNALRGVIVFFSLIFFLLIMILRYNEYAKKRYRKAKSKIFGKAYNKILKKDKPDKIEYI